MKIPRSTEVGKEKYIEGDFLDLLTEKGISCGVDDPSIALGVSYFDTDKFNMTLLEFAKKYPVFGNAKCGDSILYANGDTYLIPAKMEYNDLEETIAFFEDLAETIINGQ